MWSSKIHAGKRIANLAFFVTENQLEVYTVSKHEQSNDNLINSFIDSNRSMFKLDETQNLKLLLVKYKNIIFCNSNDFERCSTFQHQIDTGNTAPIRMAPRRIPYYQQEEVQHYIAKNEHTGIIKKSSFPWAFPILVVRKKDGTVRICVDYRRLDNITRKDAYPFIRI